MESKGYGSMIEIGLSMPGFHRWLEAPNEVKFLRNYHRHVFIISVRIAIDGDREVEFFMLQDEVENLLAAYIERQPDFTKDFHWEEFHELTGQGLDEDILVINSCEDFATWLVYHLEKKYGNEKTIEVEVSEDGENSSIVSNFY